MKYRRIGMVFLWSIACFGLQFAFLDYIKKSGMTSINELSIIKGVGTKSMHIIPLTLWMMNLLFMDGILGGILERELGTRKYMIQIRMKRKSIWRWKIIKRVIRTSILLVVCEVICVRAAYLLFHSIYGGPVVGSQEYSVVILVYGMNACFMAMVQAFCMLYTENMQFTFLFLLILRAVAIVAGRINQNIGNLLPANWGVYQRSNLVERGGFAVPVILMVEAGIMILLGCYFVKRESGFQQREQLLDKTILCSIKARKGRDSYD